MKDVDIISKVVGRKGEAMASPSKDAASFDLSGYLLKEVWDRCWEIRTTDQGEEYLFGKYPVAVQYGLTSYVDGKMLKLPSIYDGLPIDYQTLYWEETTNEDGSVTRVLKARVTGNSDGGSGNIPDLSAYVTKEEFAPIEESYNLLSNIVVKHTLDITDIKDTYAKQEWVLEKIAGLSGGGTVDLSLYATRIWVEQNYATLIQVSELSGTVEKKANLSDVYDRSEVDNKVNAKWTADDKKISNWDDAYGWGNHAEAGYVTEDLVSSLLVNKLDKSTFESWVSQNGPKIANGFTAYGWGNHAEAGYVTEDLVSSLLVNKLDKSTFESWVSQNGPKIANGFTAYGWGNHAEAGYVTEDLVSSLLVNKLDKSTFESWVSQNGPKIANGFTAYGWGNHAEAGYVTEDLVSSLLVNKLDKSTFESWVSQNGPKIANGFTAYGWGNHAEAGYVTEDLVSSLLVNKLDKSTFESWVSQNGPKIANGFTAYGWGNHAEAGYVTSLSLNETLKSYVTLGDEQIIAGKKNFRGGLLVNDQELIYNKDDGYWKMEGNLLVTGGITNYSSDGKATPFLVNADKWEDVTSGSTTQVYSAASVTLLKNEVQSVGEDADSALAKLEIIKEELSTLTESSLTTAIRTALLNIKTRLEYGSI